MIIYYIKSDLERFEKVSIKSFIKWYFFAGSCCFRYQVWLRIVQGCKKNKYIKYTFGIIAYFIFRHYEYKYGIHVDTNIHIGEGLQICHGDGVYLNARYIGKNFTCYQGVTLGANKPYEIPSIGDNVTIYAGAVCVGNIKLYNNSIIGANAFVKKDVKENSVVIGVPGKIRKR